MKAHDGIQSNINSNTMSYGPSDGLVDRKIAFKKIVPDGRDILLIQTAITKPKSQAHPI